MFIDGNHKYKYELSDIRNAAKICKLIVIDDYIPETYCNKHGLVYGPWNDDVVKAVHKFTHESQFIKRAYWIIGSRLCVIEIK